MSTGLRLYASQLTQIGFSNIHMSREVTKRFAVEPGYYLIIPNTYYEDRECDFMLRIFTEIPVDTR